MDLDWKIVTTGHEADGRACVRSDGTVALTQQRGAARVGSVLSLDGPPTSVDDGAPGSDAAGPGSLTVDAVVVEPTTTWLVEPETQASGAFEALVVVRGELHITVGDDDATLLPGSVFVARGLSFGARTSPDTETRLLLVRAEPDPKAAPDSQVSLAGRSGPVRRVRRVVAGITAAGRPGIVHDGDPGMVFVLGDEAAPMAALADVWELGGPVAAADQGGDAPEPFELEPRAGGLKILDVELEGASPDSAVPEGGWHETATIDVDVVISGTVRMHLPDLPPVVLGAGDILLQRGTNHLWQAIGDEPLRMTTVMVAVGP